MTDSRGSAADSPPAFLVGVGYAQPHRTFYLSLRAFLSVSISPCPHSGALSKSSPVTLSASEGSQPHKTEILRFAQNDITWTLTRPWPPRRASPARPCLAHAMGHPLGGTILPKGYGAAHRVTFDGAGVGTVHLVGLEAEMRCELHPFALDLPLHAD